MSSAAKVGIFMIGILAILAFFILKIEDIPFGRAARTREITAVFDSAAGLNPKSPVLVAGVDKGKVASIELRNGKAHVTLEMQADVPIYRNARARIANLGLLGEKYIELDPGTPDAAVLTEGTLPGTQTPSIDDVTAQVSAIATDVKAITESLRATVGGPKGEQRLEEIVENVRLITAEMRAMVAANRGNVDATMDNMRVITAELRVELPKLAASIDRVAQSIGGTVTENRADVRELVSNLKSLSGDLRTTSDQLGSITGQVRSGEGTVGKLIYSDEAHQKLTAALGSVESGVTELKNILARANRLSLDLGIKADYYAGLDTRNEDGVEFGGSSRSVVGLRVIPNPERNRFYNIEVSDDPRGKKRKKFITETVTDAATGQSKTTITEQTRYERDFLVSAQAGWLLRDLGLRVGLFDSSGGVGIDYQLRERLRVTGEAFDFGKKRDDNPHLRLFGEYVIRREKPHTPQVFISSGLDNPFNDLSFTVGGGIRWRDEDLKYLLGSIPLGR